MGLFRAIVIFAALLPLLFLYIYNRLQVPDYEYFISCFLLLVVFFIHRNRKDSLFLSKLLNPPVWIFFVEYFVFLLPFLLLLCFFGFYLKILIFIALLLVICFVKPSPKVQKTTKYNFFTKYIPVTMFEWRSGIRVNLPAIVFFYCLGLVGIYEIWFSAVSIALLSITFCTFYGANESQKILIASENSAGVLLRCKIKQHVKYWSLILLPFFLISIIYYEYWFFILAVFAATVNLLIFAILAKYAYYRPASNGVLSQLISLFAWLCSIALPLSILVFFTNIFLYFKAKQNINYYLNACD